jgi:hypothetical protein
MPADRPEVAVTVMVRGGGEGFDTAEPAAAAILRYYLAHRADILDAEPTPSTPVPAQAQGAAAPAASSHPPLQPSGTAATPIGPVPRRPQPAGRRPRRCAIRRRR